MARKAVANRTGRSKFLRRTARNIIFRRRPYFVHLAVTHRCNLRCRFCQIYDERFDELAFEGMRRIIDTLDAMGIAVVSISGGEPLLRPDLVEIADYAAARGLYVKVSSNGTMSRSKYQALLASRVREIAISLDGVQGDDLPNSHVSPKILENVRFLNDQLPQGKLLTLAITAWRANVDHVEDIVHYCTSAFPRARLWINPVVVGRGKLRVASETKVNLGAIHRIKTPTLLDPAYFKRACQQYYRHEVYDWGCLAGELFFDIKPNGDLWLCQDVPAVPPLNILDPDFARRYREAAFSEQRRQCSGCSYSCYVGFQKAFEPRCWRDVGVVWWKIATQPDDPCRRTALEHGWLAGIVHFGIQKMRSRISRTAAGTMIRRPADAAGRESEGEGGTATCRRASHLFARMLAEGHLAASTHARHRGPIGRQTFWPQVTR